MTRNIIVSTLMLLAHLVYGQQIKPSRFSVEGTAGLNFYNETLDLLSYDNIVPRELNPENYFRLQFIPKLNYRVRDKPLFVGTHLGFGYESFTVKENREIRVSARLFKVGAHLQYELLNFSGFRTYLELGSNYNLYDTPRFLYGSQDTVGYLKAYLDIGIRVSIYQSIDVSLLFKDFSSYHSNAINFERREGFNLVPSFQDFIEFPHFSIIYKL